MTAKEKAKDLYFKFLKAVKGVPNSDLAKESSIICVDEILIEVRLKRNIVSISTVRFWKSVKTEITNL